MDTMFVCTNQWLYTRYSFILFPSNHLFEKNLSNHSFEENPHYFNDNHSFKKKTQYFNHNHSFEKNPHYFNEAKVGTINFIHILKILNWRLVCIFHFILFCHGLGCMLMLGCYDLGIVHVRMPWPLAACPRWFVMANVACTCICHGFWLRAHVGLPWPKQRAHKHAYGHAGMSK